MHQETSHFYVIPIAMGSVLATVGGIASRVLGTTHPDAALLLAWGGLLTAFGGMIASVGSQVVAFTKIWSEGQIASQKASMERHDLANKLQLANLRILEQEKAIAEYRRHIEDSSHTIEAQIREIYNIVGSRNAKVDEVVNTIRRMAVEHEKPDSKEENPV